MRILDVQPRSDIPGSVRLRAELGFWRRAHGAAFQPTVSIKRRLAGHYVVSFGPIDPHLFTWQVTFTVVLER